MANKESWICQIANRFGHACTRPNPKWKVFFIFPDFKTCVQKWSACKWSDFRYQSELFMYIRGSHIFSLPSLCFLFFVVYNAMVAGRLVGGGGGQQTDLTTDPPVAPAHTAHHTPQSSVHSPCAVPKLTCGDSGGGFPPQSPCPSSVGQASHASLRHHGDRTPPPSSS